MTADRAPRPAARRRIHLEVNDRFRPRTDRAFLARVVEAALRHAGRTAMPVSLLLADDREVARLHARFLGDPSRTDVLSFAMDGAAEIAVSVECARREAARRGHSIRAELALYVVHGVLHACGHDDVRARDRARKRAAERTLLASLGLHIAPVE